MRPSIPSSPPHKWCALLSAVALVGAAVLGACQRSQDEPEAFKISVVEDGVYRVSYEDLAEAGLQRAPQSDRLMLVRLGQPVPIWVADGGDGRFGKGDAVEFVGEHQAGEDSYFDPYTRRNVYRLTVESEPVAVSRETRMSQAQEVAAETLAQRDVLWVDRHLEQDELRTRFSPRVQPTPEEWYWAKLSHIDRKPFELDLDMRDRQTDTARAVSLRVALRGWSDPRKIEGRPDLHSHHVDVRLNGKLVGAGDWDGQDATVVSIPEVPRDALLPTGNRLELSVPPRRPSPKADPIIDVVLLNWIEVSYPRDDRLGEEQEALRVVADPSQPVELLAANDHPVVLFGRDGSRIELHPDSDGRAQFSTSVTELNGFVVPQGALSKPVAVVPDHASDWSSSAHRADYLMITHPRLRNAIEPLAEFHRKRGLEVAVVDVDDVYDEFNGGVVSPRAIHDFVDYAYHHWQKPAPRYVLLVGDASWDPNGAPSDDRYSDWTYRPGEVVRFGKNGSTPYSDEDAGRRDLIPTWRYETFEGPAASDNYFVTVEGDDLKPDLAIGRFPVTKPEEVTAIVDKTIRYFGLPKNEAWEHNILWITNESEIFQRRSDKLAAEAAERGFHATKVYPSVSEPSNEQHQMELREAFDQGQLMVHFLGHGGRYIWRTGAPDYTKNHDLFTLEDLDRLEPTSKLPLVLSMTCYSAPFDHPTADSIGEKFLRLPERGAVAVIAASWRNSPQWRFNETLVRELLRADGGTVGEAFERAKQGKLPDLLIATYNLLGDPALELALPKETAPSQPGSGNATSDDGTQPRRPRGTR